MHFYNGAVSYQEARTMPARTFNKLWAAIDVLEAQNHIALTKAFIYPKLTKAAQKERDKKLHSIAYPKYLYKKTAKDVSFLLQTIGGTDARR